MKKVLYIGCIIVVLSSGYIVGMELDQEQQLRQMSRRGQFLATFSIDINSRNSAAITPLHWAALAGDEKMVTYLLARGALVDAKNNQGFTPFRWAHLGKHKEIIKELIKHGAHVDEKDYHGLTMLEWALFKEQLWDISTEEFGESELLYGQKTFQDIVRIQDAINKDFDTSAHESNSDGTTPLHWAAIIHNEDLAAHLLANGASVNAQDKVGLTPLHWAAWCGYAVRVEFFLKNGASIDVDHIPWKEIVRHKHYAIIDFFFPSDVNVKGSMGYFPLHWAAFLGSCELAKILINKGAYVNCCDTRGNTPWHVAWFYGYNEIRKLLVKHGADERRRSNGIIPLMPQ